MGNANIKKKKIAVFVNGWNAENVYRYLTGLTNHAPENTIDYYVFMSHAIYSSGEVELKSMSTIFDLPDLRTFDAAIMFTPGLNFTEVINQLIVKLERSGIPVICIGMQHPFAIRCGHTVSPSTIPTSSTPTGKSAWCSMSSPPDSATA